MKKEVVEININGKERVGMSSIAISIEEIIDKLARDSLGSIPSKAGEELSK